MSRRIGGSEDLKAGLRAVLFCQAYFGGFMVKAQNRFIAFDQVNTSLGILRILIMEVKAMLRVEVRIKGDIVVASNKPLSLLILLRMT